MCKHLSILLIALPAISLHTSFRSADPFASFLVMLFASTHTGTWPLPHMHTREPKQRPRALPSLVQKITPIKLAQSILKHNRVLCNSSLGCSGLKFLKAAGLHKAIMLSSRASDTHQRSSCWRLKICLNDEVCRPTLRSVRPCKRTCPRDKKVFPTHDQTLNTFLPTLQGHCTPKAVWGKRFFSRRKGRTFFWRWSATSTIFISYGNLISTSASKKWCKPTTELYSMRWAFMALLKCSSLVFCISAHVDNRWTSINVNHCEFTSAPAQAYGGMRGEPARYKARTNNWAVAATAVAPQKNKAAIDRASTSCEVSLQWLRHEGMENVRGTQDMTKA